MFVLQNYVVCCCSIGFESVQNVNLRVWTDERDLKTDVKADFIARNENSIHKMGIDHVFCSVDVLSVSTISSGVSAKLFDLDAEAQGIYLIGKAKDSTGNFSVTAANMDTERAWEALRALQVFQILKPATFIAYKCFNYCWCLLYDYRKEM